MKKRLTLKLVVHQAPADIVEEDADGVPPATTFPLIRPIAILVAQTPVDSDRMLLNGMNEARCSILTIIRHSF